MTILVACDKFKGSLSASNVVRAISNGLIKKFPKAKIIGLPMADGGDGSLAIIQTHLPGKLIPVDTRDALDRPVTSHFFLHSKTAYIELATASGIALIERELRNPLITSTYGTGLVLKHALSLGVEKIVLLLGGSSTNDAGLGIASALGFEFYDEKNKRLSGVGKNLKLIKKIIPPQDLPKFELEILSDVEHPMYGPNGAAHTFAKQKGADEDAIELLEEGLKNIAGIISQQFGKTVDKIPGGGSAGAIAAGLHGLLNGKIRSGFEFIAKMTTVEEKIRNADLVITGEGKLDQSSIQGKVIGNISKLCQAENKKLIVMVGKNDLTKEEIQAAGIHQVFELVNLTSEKDAIVHAEKHLEAMALQV